MHTMRKMQWNELLKKKRWTFLLGCLIGSLVFVLLYGVAIIDVTNIGWLYDSSRTEGLWDLTQHYLGWEFYRNSAWHFPLGLVDGLYSEPVSIVYTDSIPLFAFFFKLLSPILPETFQYFGIFGLLSYALMGGFGALITRRLTSFLPINLMSALLFSLSPCMLKRMFYHTALAAHFLIPAAICLWLYRSSFAKKRTYIGLWTLLVAVSALINAYFTPMILGIMLCSLLQEMIAADKVKAVIGSVLLNVLIPVAVLAVVCYVAGYFYGDVSAYTTSLEKLSFNLLQFWNPANDLCTIEDRTFNFATQNYSSLLPALPTTSGWQEEGFSYLGLGMIVLLVIVLIMGMVAIKRCGVVRQKRRWVSIGISVFIGGIVFTFLALSPTATFGSSVLYQITYPDVIYQALSVFRSTGRLIWPVYYGLMAATLLGLVYLMQRKRAVIGMILAGICILQIYDLSPALSYKHNAYVEVTNLSAQDTKQEMTSSVYQTYLTSDVWDELAEEADHIMFYPPTEFGIQYDPMTSCIFEEYALANDLTLNVTYMSRDMSRKADEKTIAHFEERANGRCYDDIIYIFFDISEIPPVEKSHLQYYLVDGYIIGTQMDLSGQKDVMVL